MAGLRGRAPTVVLLIDEIDKADIEFPNDLLRELDRMEFHVYETRRPSRPRHPADRLHHLQQREGAARRLPAPLLLPLHRSPTGTRCSDRRRPFPGMKQALLQRGAEVFFGLREGAGPEEEAVDSGSSSTGSSCWSPRHPARGCCARTRRPASRRCTAPAQERAGHAPFERLSSWPSATAGRSLSGKAAAMLHRLLPPPQGPQAAGSHQGVPRPARSPATASAGTAWTISMPSARSAGQGRAPCFDRFDRLRRILHGIERSRAEGGSARRNG